MYYLYPRNPPLLEYIPVGTCVDIHHSYLVRIIITNRCLNINLCHLGVDKISDRCKKGQICDKTI